MATYRRVPARSISDLRAAPGNGEAAAAEPDEPNLSAFKKDELVALAEERGVDSSGTKAEIIERLEA